MLPVLFHKKTTFRILFFSLTVFCLINLCGGQSAQAKIQLDGTFAPALGKFNYGPDSVLVLPDGKLVVIRLSSQNLLGKEEYKVTRLNPDGSVDRVFDSVVTSWKTGKLLLQPDGKIIAAFGTRWSNTNVPPGGIFRFNADGTLDTSFNAGWILSAATAALQADGKIVLGGVYSPSPGFQTDGTVRLNPDGSRDSSFTPATGAEVMAIQSSGKIILGFGSGSGFRIIRLNANGTLDTAFTGLMPGSSALTNAASIIIEPDDRIIVGGGGIVRLNSDGSEDTSFTPENIYDQYQVHNLVRQADGKILVGGSPFSNTVFGSMLRKTLFRVNANGTLDTTFDAMINDDYDLYTFTPFKPVAVRPNGTILVSGESLVQSNVRRSGLISLNQSGTIDQNFTSDFGKVAGSVDLLANDPDGKIMVAGDFVEANNFPTFSLVRLNLNGTTDTGFTATDQITGKITAIAFQANGKILIGGRLRFNNQNNYGVFRLNQDGSLDASFTPKVFTVSPGFNFSRVKGIAVQADGKILVGGTFLNYGNSGRDNFVRLNTDGTVDATYTATSDDIRKMLVQPDGKIIVYGTVTINGNTRTFPRLNTDGSLDPTFNVVPSEVGYEFAIAPNGKLASAGGFTSGNHSVVKVFRLNNDGSKDLTFTETNLGDIGSVQSLIVQHDGRIIVNVHSKLIRLKVNGGFERSFNEYPAQIRDLLIVSGRNLIIGGFFSSIASAGRTGIARYLVNSSDYDFDGDGIADISLFRPSVGEWYILRSTIGSSFGTNFGLQGDLITPADFDGDGKTDIAVFRPSDGGLYRLNSFTNTFSALQFGASGDLPVPGDFDGDGKADIAVYRPSAGSWYRISSSNNQFIAAQFGIAEDKPIVGDFNGDGRADLIVFRPSNGTWYRIHTSTNQFLAAQFGTAEDKPVAADYDNDGKTDLAVYRPSNGTWYLVNSSNNSFAATQFGVAEDKPSAADFDGDGRTDLAVFRPSNGTWYLLRSTAGFTGIQFGANGDAPAPNAFVR